jgi:addiction module HigA family antidote
MTWSDLPFRGMIHAARWYSLITPPSTLRLCTRALSGTMTGSSWSGARWFRDWCGRCPVIAAGVGPQHRPQVRIPADRAPTPPREMLLEEFIKPLGMTQAELADRIGVSYVRLNEIVNGRRGITPSTALRLAKAFSTSPQLSATVLCACP